jgi:hypothetical protein
VLDAAFMCVFSITHVMLFRNLLCQYVVRQTTGVAADIYSGYSVSVLQRSLHCVYLEQYTHMRTSITTHNNNSSTSSSSNSYRAAVTAACTRYRLSFR